MINRKIIFSHFLHLVAVIKAIKKLLSIKAKKKHIYKYKIGRRTNLGLV